ncbi:hypothetical protein NQ314_007390 [Rhamnusium bicolor]|uniref:Uncharacterized protein n=1 Tax=Rhamnusium bicolor TaxID=1586634 RepID=A0AAV8YMS2_9CUCU|nr:hypothetical protein NQ314_007390 [Rhamnusium bicolor]
MDIQRVTSELQPEAEAGIKNLPQNVVPLEQYVPYYTSQLGYEPYYSAKNERAPVTNVEKIL